MASASYDSQCRQIYLEICKKLERVNDPQLRFAPSGTAEKVLLRDNSLPLFFHSLALHGNTATEQLRLTEAEFVERIENRQLYDFLALLIFTNCSIEAARAFTSKLVAGAIWPVRGRETGDISSLPASRDDLIDLFGNEVDADQFFNRQAPFCTVMIRKRGEVTIENLKARRLPYLKERPLAEGSFGKVFKVTIAKGHFYDPQHCSVNAVPLKIARKDYVFSKEFRVKGEHEIMEKLLTSSAQKCNNILENYGSLDIKPDTYSLFMPLAMCDLRAYMVDHRPANPPSTVADKANFIRSAPWTCGWIKFSSHRAEDVRYG